MKNIRDKIEKIVLNALVNIEKSRELGLSEFEVEQFQSDEHREIFKKILQYDAEGTEFDSLLIAGDMAETYPLCIEYLSRDSRINDEAISWLKYFEIFKDMIKKEKIKAGIREINKKMKDGKAEDIIELLIETAEKAQLDKKDKENFKYVYEDNSDFYDNIISRREKKERISGIATGYSSLDFYLSGLKKGNLITIAGRTSMGKSAIALQIAYNIASRGIPVLYFHQEASSFEVKERLVSSAMNINNEVLKRAALGNNEIEKLKKFLSKEIPLIFDYTAGVNIEHIIKTIRRAKVKEPELAVVIIDHLQFMQYPKGMSNNDALDYITKKFLACLKKENLVGIQLSQLNRLQDRENRMPKLSDLRDSGSIEQNSHIVLFIERAIHDEPKRKMKKNDGILHIAKNRNGEVGVSIKMRFYEEYVRYDEVENEI